MPKFNPTQILEKVLELNASDLHLTVGSVPVVRVFTKLQSLKEYVPLTEDDVEAFLAQVLDQQQRDLFNVNKEIDLSLALGTKARFRLNAFYQKGYPSVSIRTVPMRVPTIEELHLPPIFSKICDLKQGLVLVAGPTGSGKTTTMASMVDRINEARAEHIITIEDPIEYVFKNKLSLVEQRELHTDTHSWTVALKGVVRQDPNVVVVGEMRDLDTIEAVLQISETGHLVFASLHTNSASQTVDRIIAAFPSGRQDQVRLQLAASLEAVFSQRLLPSIEGDVVPAVEVLLATDPVRSIIREGRTFMLNNVIATSASQGMCSLEKSLADLVNKKVVDFSYALRVAPNHEELRRRVVGAPKESKGIKG